MNKRKATLVATVLVAAVGVGGWTGLSWANGHGGHGQMNHGQMDHGATHEAGYGAVPGGASPSTRAYMEANEIMHADMAIEFTSDADIDFAKGMIPHHEGAIAMAQIVLEHEEDPEIRTLAQEIIAAQESEISFLRDCLAARGH